MPKITHKKYTIIGALALVTIVVAFAILFWPRQVRRDDECGRPPGPFYGLSGNVEVTLEKTLAVFKGKADPKVIDVIPAEARTLEMVGYLSCKANKAGLISSNQELREYTSLLGDIARGNPIKRYVRHFGTLNALQDHLRKSPENGFILQLSGTSRLIGDFWVDEISAKSWQEWFQKTCALYAGCLICEPDAAEIHDRVKISASAGVTKLESGDEKRVGCQG